MGICIRLIQNFIKFGWSTIYHVINFITFLDITISQPNRKVLTNKLLNLFRPRLRAQFKKKGYTIGFELWKKPIYDSVSVT